MAHSNDSYPLAFFLVGFLLLLFGRSLFWLFVAAAGFLLGAAATAYLLPHQSSTVVLLVALLLGILGALLAIFVQKIAIAVGGFIAGGYLGVTLGMPLLAQLGLAHLGYWPCFVIGGILGAIVMVAFFNWALIILSSLQGAHMIIRGLPAIRGAVAVRHYHPLLFIFLAIIGIIVQAATYRGRKTKTG